MDLRDLLIHTALDPALRQAVRSTPDAALAPYTLTAEERDAVLRADTTLLPHIARAALGPSAPVVPTDAPVAASTTPAGGASEHILRLRLRPWAVHADGAMQVGYTASLDAPAPPPPTRSAPSPDALSAAVADVHSADHTTRLPALRALLELL
ncbi:MAG: hypothetical protein ACI8PZ_003456 [Myxococcota bacterium]|jgi:hypothetical protein